MIAKLKKTLVISILLLAIAPCFGVTCHTATPANPSCNLNNNFNCDTQGNCTCYNAGNECNANDPGAACTAWVEKRCNKFDLG